MICGRGFDLPVHRCDVGWAWGWLWVGGAIDDEGGRVEVWQARRGDGICGGHCRAFCIVDGYAVWSVEVFCRNGR